MVGTTAAAVWSPCVSASTSTERAGARRGPGNDDESTTWSVARATTARRRWRSTGASRQRASRGRPIASSRRRSRGSFARISPGRAPRESFTMRTRSRDPEGARVSSWVVRSSPGRRPRRRPRSPSAEAPWRRTGTRRWWIRSIATHWRALSRRRGSRREGAFWGGASPRPVPASRRPRTIPRGAKATRRRMIPKSTLASGTHPWSEVYPPRWITTPLTAFRQSDIVPRPNRGPAGRRNSRRKRSGWSLGGPSRRRSILRLGMREPRPSWSSGRGIGRLVRGRPRGPPRTCRSAR